MAVDPAHPLLTRANRPTESRAKHRQHAAHGTPIRAQHDADAQNHHPAGGRGSLGLLLPIAAKGREEIIPSVTTFAKAFCLTGSIEAHRRGIHQHAGGLGQRRHGSHQGRCGGQTAGTQDLALGLTPTPLGDGFTGQIDHTAGRLQGRQQLRLTPTGGLGRVECQANQTIGKVGERLGAPTDQGEFMALVEQPRHKLPAYEPGTSQQQQTHRSSGGGGLRLGVRQGRRADLGCRHRLSR